MSAPVGARADDTQMFDEYLSSGEGRRVLAQGRTNNSHPILVTPGRHRQGAPIVLVDMDGVIADFVGGFWPKFGAAHPGAPLRSEVVEDQFHIEDQMDEVWRLPSREIAAAPGFFTDLLPIAGATQALNGMLELGWEVFICTTPLRANRTCASDKVAWLEEHIGAGWGRRTILTHDKGLVRGDVLIDDKPAISSLVTPTWDHVVFDATYNQASTAPARLTGWTNWYETLVPIVESAP